MNYWEKGAEPFSFGYLLENIFNVKSADDIKSVVTDIMYYDFDIDEYMKEELAPIPWFDAF